MKFAGIYTPVVTPFDKDGGVDWAKWSSMLEFQIEQGVHGLVIGGSTGEYYALTGEERVKQFANAKKIVRDRLPVIAGVNSVRVDESVGYAEAARDAHADGLLLAAPPYSLPTEQELAEHCMRIARAAGLPVMLYNYPARTGVDMGEQFLSRIGRNSNFQAIKESSGDIGRLHCLAREFPHIQLSCGTDDQALEFFAWGATSWVCAAANFLPEETVALYETCAIRSDFVTGRKIMKALLPLMSLLERGGQFIQCVKQACESQGVPCSAKVRPPMRQLNEEMRKKVQVTVQTLKTTVGKILAEAL